MLIESLQAEEDREDSIHTCCQLCQDKRCDGVSHLCPALQGALQQGSQGELTALHVLVLKCRDKNAHVRAAAYEMLAATHAQSLHAVLLPSDWRTVIDGGLGVWAELSETGLSLCMRCVKLVATTAALHSLTCTWILVYSSRWRRPGAQEGSSVRGSLCRCQSMYSAAPHGLPHRTAVDC